MAHACDYASRLPVKQPSIKQRVVGQVTAFLNAHNEWPKEALRVHCMATYRHMGLTEKIYGEIIANYV